VKSLMNTAPHLIRSHPQSCELHSQAVRFVKKEYNPPDNFDQLKHCEVSGTCKVCRSALGYAAQLQATRESSKVGGSVGALAVDLLSVEAVLRGWSNLYESRVWLCGPTPNI
jgi:hypothetical protein